MPEPLEHNEPPPADADVHRVVSAGPSGTFAVAGVATAVVILIYLVFYFFVHMPRGLVQ